MFKDLPCIMTTLEKGGQRSALSSMRMARSAKRCHATLRDCSLPVRHKDGTGSALDKAPRSLSAQSPLIGKSRITTRGHEHIGWD